MTVDAILDELLGGKTAYPSAPDEWGRACDPGSSSAVRGVVRSARSHDRDLTLTLYANVGPVAQTDSVWQLARSNQGGPQ